jgi:hypothetical protein
VLFVRKGNPVSLAAKGLVAVFDDTLTRAIQPILACDPTFDVILLASSVWILTRRGTSAVRSASTCAKVAWAARTAAARAPPVLR